jgi:hypothetical protein
MDKTKDSYLTAVLVLQGIIKILISGKQKCIMRKRGRVILI